VERLAPRGSRARAALVTGRAAAIDARSFASRTRWRWRWSRSPSATTPSYLEWLDHHRPKAEELAQERHRVGEASIRIGVHCVVLAAGADAGALQRTMGALKRQTFPGWTATVAGGRPISPGRQVDSVEAEGEALRLAEGGEDSDFILILAAGDVPEPDLLFNVAARGWDDPSLDLIHWDDDLLDETGRAHDPRFRPSWSPEMLLSANYLGRSFAVRRRRLAAAGGFVDGGGDGRWWELLLRLGLEEREVERVPRVLVHVGRRPQVAAADGVALVAAHLERSGLEAEVSEERGAVRVRWALPEPPTVSIVIPTRSRETLLRRCLDQLALTDYPSFDVTVVDSGERDGAAERWYADRDDRFGLDAVWWEGEFNYSAANNLGAAVTKGEVLVFLNDDVEISSPDWLTELVGWATRPEIGLAGLQLVDGGGAIQHGGVVIGMTGFGGHLFAGMQPGEDSILGSTDWYRNCLSVTAACVAVERDLYQRIGGFDERFVLCGSDVVLGLDARFHGKRSICSPFGGVRHLESVTRGENVPPEDFFTSYWRYQTWLRGGDPYFSPNLSLQHTEPTLRGLDEPTAMAVVGSILGREFSVFRQRSDEEESKMLAKQCRADRSLERRVREQHEADSGRIEVRTVNWVIPDVDSPFYGGINTAFRIAQRLALEHGVENQFIVAGAPNERYIRSAIDAAFPAISDSKIVFSDGQSQGPNIESMPAADVTIATQWHTAYIAANVPHTRRRFYLIQDFEPGFYPAGTNYALAEESYRLGLYGICNTERMLSLFQSRYGGEGMSFMPAVDGSVFHARDRRERAEGDPVTVFTYARPGHWRNCWELASPALAELKRRLGLGVRIVTAGSWATPNDLGRGIEHLGLLDYRDTGKLYRQADLGIALTVSEHPSYLPLELLACGAPVVAFDNPAGDWIIQHEVNSIRCPRTVDGLAEGLERLATDAGLRGRLRQRGLEDIAARHGDWDVALAGIYDYLCDPGSGS
jgi:GT2 family glycosyltransferase/glycosyltransferase involved in cell wall biosynthesis